MFLPIEGGSCIEVQGLKCWIPAPGKIWDPRNKQWLTVPIAKRARSYEDCYWEPDPRWKKYREWEREEVILQAKDPKFIHQDLAKFINEMWRYRLGGYWYYNNNVPTYLTGQNWFYLSVYHLDVGLPRYRDIDRLFFYAWQYCVEDPECYGLCEVTKRRSGKTYRSASIALEFTSRIDNFQSGIQSKNEPDAKSVFKKAIIGPYRKFPSFFQPKDNMSRTGKVPASELRFSSGTAQYEDDELESWIDFRPSPAGAYDGQKLGFYLADEVGKAVEVDVEDRWNTVRPCLRDDNRMIIGKTIHTTTVEDMDNGGRAFAKLWKDSDQNDKGKDKDGTERKRTKSGLYRIFFPADHSGMQDKYGFANREAVREQILEDRIGLDARALSSAKRKDPLNEKEAFQMDASSCAFNPEILNAREEILKYMEPQYRRGNFHWEDGIRDTKVYFADDNNNGKFLLMWEPDEARRNLKIIKGDIACPGDRSGGGGGIDPFDHNILASGSEYTMSLGGMCFIKRANPMDGSLVEGGPCLIYLARPDNPETFYEDAIMAAHYYGWQVLIEDNKPRCLQYFADRGYEQYCYTLPGKTKPGINAGARNKGGGSNALIAEITAQFIEEHADTVHFLELIEQWLSFTPMDTTKFDLAMAFGYAYMLVQRIVVKEAKRNAAKKIPIASFMVFNKTKRRGLFSR